MSEFLFIVLFGYSLSHSPRKNPIVNETTLYDGGRFIGKGNSDSMSQKILIRINILIIVQPNVLLLLFNISIQILISLLSIFFFFVTPIKHICDSFTVSDYGD